MQGHNDWLLKALSDLRSSKKLCKDDDDTLDTAAYHTQQCAEKALKAYLVFCNKPVPRTHDLEKILEQCVKLDQLFYNYKKDVLELTPYATYSRYPDDQFSIDRPEIEEAINKAAKIYRFVEKRIQERSNPNLNLFE